MVNIMANRGNEAVQKAGYIGIDISTTSATLFAMARVIDTDKPFWCFRGQHGVIGGTTLTTPTVDDVMDSIDEIVSRLFKTGVSRVTIGVEVFTESISENDRTHSAKKIKAITDEVVRRIKATNEKMEHPLPVGPAYPVPVTVLPLTPYQWRSVFELPTRVDTESTNFKTQAFARLLGHDILKRFSVNKTVELINRIFDDEPWYYFIGSDNQRNAQVSITAQIQADDNLAEAFLIASAVSANEYGHVEIKDVYYNTYYLKPEDIIEYANSPEAFSTTSIWV